MTQHNSTIKQALIIYPLIIHIQYWLQDFIYIIDYKEQLNKSLNGILTFNLSDM